MPGLGQDRDRRLRPQLAGRVRRPARRSPRAEISRNYVRRAIDEGTQPALVADHVVDAIRTGRFWVLPQAEFLEIAIERWHGIGEGREPDAARDSRHAAAFPARH